MAKKFVCTVCGYVHEGETAPEFCPVCKHSAHSVKLQLISSRNWLILN